MHPTQKSVKLYRWIIQNYIKSGWKVLDTYTGSGSSLIAYEGAGIDYIAFEIDPYYYDLASKRLKEYRAQITLYDLGMERKC